jgi:hypothetical protein
MSRTFLHTMLERCAPNAVRAIRQGYHDLDRLPYRRLWVIDTEFRTGGDPHRTWCVSGLELRTGDRFELWTDGRYEPPPFPADHDTLVIAFVAGAEMACWHQQGWPRPARILDLFQEARIVTNTGSKADPQGLVAMCRHVGISVLDLETKAAMQLEAQSRTFWPDDMRARLMGYCSSDVTATAQLFLAVWPDMLRLYGKEPERGLYFTLLRGECAAAMGKAELRGIPANTVDWPVLQAGRLNIYPAMVSALSGVARNLPRHPEGPGVHPACLRGRDGCARIGNRLATHALERRTVDHRRGVASDAGTRARAALAGRGYERPTDGCAAAMAGRCGWPL